MNKLSTRVILEYLIWAVLGVLIVVLVKLFPAIGSISFYFLFSIFYFLLLPGWLLGRVLKVNYECVVGWLLFNFTLGLGFYLLLSLMAIFGELSPEALVRVYWFSLIILFFIALICEVFISKKEPALINWQETFKKENILYLVPLLLGIVIILVIEAKGANFDGDPALHLAIVRKAFDGNSLAPQALALTKTSAANPAYAFPAWHVLIALLAKITHLDIFTVWSKLTLPLTIISLFSWFFLFQILFEKRSYTALATVIFMGFVFYTGTGYFFQRLPVPDTFSQFILLPLTLGLGLKYIFPSKDLGTSSSSQDKKILIPIAVLLLAMLLVHGLQFFYFIILIIFLCLLLIIARLFDRELTSRVKKNGWLVGLGLGILLIFGLVLEFKAGFISATLKSFSQAPPAILSYEKFSSWGLPYKWGLLLSPLILLFLASRRMIFIPAAILLAPLVYWTPLKDVFGRLLSFIFVDRLLANVFFYFLVIALVLGTILIFLERRIQEKLAIKVFVVSALMIVLGLLIILEISWQSVSSGVYLAFFSKTTAKFISQQGLSIFFGIIILTAILFFAARKKPQYFLLQEFKSNFSGFLIILIIAFLFFAPASKAAAKNLRASIFFQDKKILYENQLAGELGNDKGVVDFIRNELPSRSVILADPVSSKAVAMLANQYLAYYPGSSWEKTLNSTFSENTPAAKREAILFQPKFAIDYVFLRVPALQGEEYFQSRPELYQKIYNGQVKIYKVIK